MKRKVIISSFIIIIIALISKPALSYFTSETTAKNIIKMGNIDLKIHEKIIDEEKYVSQTFDIMPGDTISKTVTVENTSDHPLYLKVKLTKSIDNKIIDDEKYISMNLNIKDWTYANGYYYYNTVLKPKEITPALFTEIYIDEKNVDNSCLGKKFSLDISAYAVQSENNGDNVWSAFGWPVE